MEVVFTIILVGAAYLILNRKINDQSRELQKLRRDIHDLRNYIDYLKKTPPVQESESAPIQAYDPVASTPPPIQIAEVAPAPPVSKKPSLKLNENWVGRNVLGIAASVLVFIGLIFLGVLVYEYITDTIKIVLMFTLSLIMTGAGIFLCLRGKNTFTVILTGCGYGSFFISILLTHIYFGSLPVYAALPLLLLWMAAALYTARLFESVSLSVVAHIGMVSSICFAYTLSFTLDRMIPLFIYQIASITLITLGNILCCKKTYRFGLFISMTLTIVTSMFMWNQFQPSYSTGYYGLGGGEISPILISVLLIVQFIGASFLSYLLAVSTSRLGNSKYSEVLHGLNKLLWVGALFLNIYGLIYRLVLDNNYGQAFNPHLYAVFYAVAVTFVIVSAHAVLSIFIRIKLNFCRTLETISVIIMSVTALILMLLWWQQISSWRFEYPALPLLFIPGALLLFAAYKARSKVYLICANAFFALDFILMLTPGYYEMAIYGSIWLSLIYMLIYPAVIWGQWYAMSGELRKRYFVPAKIATYVTVQFSLVAILLVNAFDYSDLILMLIMTAAHVLLNMLRYDKDSNILKWTLWAGSHIWIAVSTSAIAFSDKEPVAILYLLLMLTTSALAFARMRKTLTEGGDVLAELLYGIKLTLLTLAFINGFTSWFEQVYIFSLACMLTSLASIVAGFKFQTKFLRLYGLFLTLLCVLKLVTYDVAGLDTVLRVVSLIGGGIICFIISAVYSYSVKKYKG